MKLLRKTFLTVSILLTAFVSSTLGQTPKPDKKGWIGLFNGRDLTGWHVREAGKPNNWKAVDGVYSNNPPSVDIMTDTDYYDFQLHVEFNVAKGANAGVYMRDKYEIQIFDSFGQPPSFTAAGALYRKISPAVNASKPAGEWQSYDMTFIGQRLSVWHNGQKVLDNVIVGPAGTGQASKRPDGPGPLRLQGDHGAVSVRNVRIRPLSKAQAEKLQKQMDKQSAKSNKSRTSPEGQK